MPGLSLDEEPFEIFEQLLCDNFSRYEGIPIRMVSPLEQLALHKGLDATKTVLVVQNCERRPFLGCLVFSSFKCLTRDLLVHLAEIFGVGGVASTASESDLVKSLIEGCYQCHPGAETVMEILERRAASPLGVTPEQSATKLGACIDMLDAAEQAPALKHGSHAAVGGVQKARPEAQA